MAKIITGIFSFLGTVTILVLLIIEFVEDSEWPAAYLLVALCLLIISYLIITKFWQKGEGKSSESSKLKREINLLKKQIEINRLKKELDELGKFSNAN